MSHIRKIAIGPDYKSSMNYVIGQKVLGGSYTIHLIQQDDEDGSIRIWIEQLKRAIVKTSAELEYIKAEIREIKSKLNTMEQRLYEIKSNE